MYWRVFVPPIFYFVGVGTIAQERAINNAIRVSQVRLIDEDGTQLGTMSRREAQAIADEKGMDLVLMAPDANPPVCRVMDYGKFKFEQAKREKEARKNQKVTTIKEVQLSATIQEHDVITRVKAATKFLQDEDKVKVSIRFRGRQMWHTDIGVQVMNDFYEKVQELAVIERPPKLEGRNMTMILAPRTKVKK